MKPWSKECFHGRVPFIANACWGLLCFPWGTLCVGHLPCVPKVSLAPGTHGIPFVYKAMLKACLPCLQVYSSQRPNCLRNTILGNPRMPGRTACGRNVELQ